ncbi:hypothetical protein VTL71DRAFT_15749, partial [Oculimacula yallundae]
MHISQSDAHEWHLNIYDVALNLGARLTSSGLDCAITDIQLLQNARSVRLGSCRQWQCNTQPCTISGVIINFSDRFLLAIVI